MLLDTLKSLFLSILLLLPGATLSSGGETQRIILAHHSFGSGPEKVLVLHSWMDDASSFDLLKPYLNSERYTYVFADLRGYGRSMELQGRYDEQEISADAFQLASYLGWKTFHLIGHSMSGMAAQRMAIDDWKMGERRIKSVIAINPVTVNGYPADEETRKFLWDLIHDRALSEQGTASLTRPAAVAEVGAG